MKQAIQYKNLLLDNQLCFALYAATHAITRAYRSRLSQYGLTYSQYLVLLVLWETDKLTVKHIAQSLKLDSGTLTPLLKRLENADLISRVRSQQDERELIIGLTTAGKRLRHKIAGLQKEVACETGLKIKEFEELKKTLNRLTETISTRQDSDSEAA